MRVAAGQPTPEFLVQGGAVLSFERVPRPVHRP
jgi:hypothetical protein